MSNTTQAIEPTEIELLLDKDALALTERRARWARYRNELLPMVRAFQKLNATFCFPNSLDVSISGDKHTLAAVVRIFRTHGFSTFNSPPKKGSSSWTAFYEKRDCELRWYLSFSSSVCRRVKVGTRTVEQDVYETVCDEITMPEAAVA